LAVMNDALANIAAEFAVRNAPLAKLPAEFATLDGVFAFKKAACAYASDNPKICSNVYELVLPTSKFTPTKIVFALLVVILPCVNCEIFTVDIVYPNRIEFSSSVINVSPLSVASSGIYGTPTEPYNSIWFDDIVLFAMKVLFTAI